MENHNYKSVALYC